MKKKIFIAVIAAVVVGLCSLAVFVYLSPDTLVSSTAGSEKNAEAGSVLEQLDDKVWVPVKEGTVSLENSRVKFELDAATTTFKVTDKGSGQTYDSNPWDKSAYSGVAEEIKTRMSSPVSIVFYDPHSKRFVMGSTPDSVEQGHFEVRKSEDKIRVYYTLGETGDSLLVPKAFTKETFENTILAKIDTDKAKRRLKKFYIKYSSNDDISKDELDKLKAQYPYLEKGELYILTTNPEKRVLEELTGYFKSAGYTKQNYEEDLKMIGGTQEIQELPGFTIPVEYSIDENGFRASVLSEQIIETSKKYKLQSLMFLEYFASCTKGTEGYMLVPDGSGAIIEINKERNSGTNYVQPLYGEDEAIKKKKVEQFSKTASLPVFGFKQGENAVFAIIESGEGAAQINANTQGKANPRNNIYASFTLRSTDITDIGAARQLPVFNLFPKHLLRETISVKYSFLTGDSADYSGMAGYYQDYLVKKGVLRKAEAEKEESIPFYIDFTSSIIDNIKIFGVSVDKKIKLTGFDDASQILQKLKDQGINGVKARFKGYSPGGLAHYVMDELIVDKVSGGEQGLSKLTETLGKLGYKLYLDVDIPYVYKDGILDNFKERKHTARNLDRSIVRQGDFDLAEYKIWKNWKAKYSVSPSVYKGIAEGFKKGFDDLNLEKREALGISAGTLGAILNSDFNVKNEYDRCMSQNAINDALAALSGEKKDIMTDYGNGYVLGYTRDILSIPLTASGFEAESEPVPFYPMVVHGYVDYAGIPMNLAPDFEKNILKSIETGAGLYFSWISGTDDLLKDTDYEFNLYSLDYRKTMDQAVGLYQKMNPEFKGLSDKRIIKHRKVLEGVYETTYENGTRVYVNYTGTEVSVEGQNIGAMDYRIN